MADEYGGKAVWFMAGIAIGATVALLYAPATGEDTRRQLTRKAKKGREALADSGSDLVESTASNLKG
jgi:gas vesicle protein